MSFLPGLLLLLLVMPCSLSPGLLLVRRLRFGPLETCAGAIGVSGLLIYLFATAVYLSGATWNACWGYVAFCALATFLVRRDLRGLWHRSIIRRQAAAYGLLVLLATFMLSVIVHYSGALWAGDWREHFERTIFFLHRSPIDMKFIGLYALPARPPMMNLVAAFFMGVAGDHFELYQFIFSALNLQVIFAAVLLSVHFARGAPRRVWLIFAILALNPLVMQNATWSWTKLYSAFYVMLAIAFYLRGLHRNDPRRIAFAAAMMCGALLVHYSAGPFALVIAAHYLLIARRRERPGLEISAAALVTLLLLGSWFGWSIARYGTSTTVASNTSVTEAQHLSATENVLKIGSNILHTIIPPPLAVSQMALALDFDQPNPFGRVRDFCFVLYQQNLPLAFGSIGWMVLVVIIWRNARDVASRHTRFWMALTLGAIVIGIATHGAAVDHGLTHVCLQPLVLIGLTCLAAGLPALPRGVRIAVVVLIAVDAVLGIVLQLRMQSLSFALWPDIPGGPSPERGYQVVPFVTGLLNELAIQNSALRYKLGVQQFADAFGGVQLPLFVIIVGSLVAALMVLGRSLQVGRLAPWIASLLLIAGSGVALSDRASGYTDTIPSDLPSAPRVEAAEIEARIAPLRQAVEANPSDPALRYALGKAYYNLRQLDPAAETLSDGFLVDPSYLPNRYLLRLLLRTHDRDMDQVLASIAERYLYSPADPLIQRNLARARADRNLPAR
jgi:hypothetical protein